MPAQGIVVKPKSEILSFGEILRLGNVFVGMGVKKIRITGGEPLVRQNLDLLVADLKTIPGLSTLALTTNGILLKEQATSLKKAGLDAVNISLDTLNEKRFEAITRRNDFKRVLSGIETAIETSFSSIKLNVVVIRGVNDDEILDMLNFVKDSPINIRFIEYMPFEDNNWCAEKLLSYRNIRDIIERHYTLIPLLQETTDVAKDFQILGHKGRVSFITSMSESFCGNCNRLRLTAEGSIKACLFSNAEVSLRDAMRSGADNNELEELILQSLSDKPEAHDPIDKLASSPNRTMIQIGG
jgi:cyclic pyranopterin phosphate synthase